MKDLTQGNVFRQMVSFSVPMLLGNLFQSLYSLIDAIFVGRMLGTEALAAVSVSAPLIFFLIAMLIGLSIATNVLVGQAFGAKNHEMLSRIVSSSFLLNLVICVLLTFAGIAFGRLMLMKINTPAGLLDRAFTFFSWFSAGIIFLVINNWLYGLLRGLGDSNTPLYLTAATVILNILLIPPLIKGYGIIPPLGIAGSALATVLANFMTMIAGYTILAKRNSLFRITAGSIRPDFGIVKKIAAIGLPASFQLLIVSFSGIILMAIVNLFGGNVIAAYGIGIRMDNFSFLPAMSVGMAVSSMVAQSLGAGLEDRVKEIVACGIRLTAGMGLFIIVIFTLVPAALSRLFTADENVIVHAVLYLRIMCWSYLVLSIFFIFQSAVRGAGDMTVPLFFVIVIMIVRVALAWGLGRYTPLEETGVWLSILLSSMLGVMMIYPYYRKGSWKNKVVVRKM